MAQPVYLSEGRIDVVAEFRLWLQQPQWQDAVDTIAKLTAVAQHGMDLIRLFSVDTHAPPDLFCRQLNGWACFYVARPLNDTEAFVVALHCTPVSSASGLAAAKEAQRRRALAGI
jgi:hypothetical protein